MRTRLLAGCAAVLLLSFTASAARAQTADEIIQRHLAALGGREAVAKISSRRATGAVTVTSAVGDLAGAIEVDQKAPSKIRSFITLDLTAVGAGQMTIERRFDGTRGFVYNSIQGDSAMAGADVDNARNAAFPTAFLNYTPGTVPIAVLPHENIGGVDAVGLQVTPKSGPPIRIYFDASTFLLIRTVTTVSAPQAASGTVTQTSDYADYRVVDGVKVPFQTTNVTPTQTVSIKLSKVEDNVEMDDALFTGK
jgi:outer membrane lipoprotein-sorting protein